MTWPFRRIPPPGAARADREEEIREELELYLELRTEELIREGWEPEAARREAEARFGDPQEIERRLRREARRRGREGGWRMMMANLGQDVRFTFRSFRLNPGFTLVAVLTLAIALAGNTAIFSVLDAAVLRALPFPDHERLVFVNGYHLRDGERAIRYASVPEFRDWREQSSTIDPMVAVDPNSVTLGGLDVARRVVAELVSEGYFEILDGRTLLGRTFTPEEARTPGGFPVAVLSHHLWQEQYGGDRDIVGRSILVNDRSLTVLGVMREGFAGANLNADLWVPFGMMPMVAPGILDSRGTRFLPVIGRLADGATQDEAQAELDAIALGLQEQFPDAHEDRFAQVQSFKEGYLGQTGRLLWLLVGAGGLLLLIASANVANLLLVRAHARTRELVVRRALGAEGSRVARQLLTEGMVLSTLGAVIGLVLTGWSLGFLTALIPAGVLPPYATPSLSPRVFLFTLAVLTVVGLLAGAAPAVSSARRDIAAALRAGARGLSVGRSPAQRTFVVSQVALALLLMVGAGLMTRSFQAQLAVDPGLDMEGMQVFRIQAPRERYPDAASLRVFADEVVRAVASVPGVTSVAASSDFPFRGRSSGAYIYRPDDPETRIRYHHHMVSPNYFDHLGTELVAGRLFDESDRGERPGVVVVTQALVDRVFPGEASGVGKRLFLFDPTNPENEVEIIGVVENVRYRNLTQSMMDGPNSPDVFVSLRQMPARSYEISYRAAGDQGSFVQAVRTAVADVDASVPVYAESSLDTVYRAQTATPRFAAFLMGLFSSVALVLACVGMYGVLAFSVGQRRQEIAVRRALGANATSVAGALVMDGIRLTAMGLGIGAVVALASARIMEAFLFNVEPTDPATLGVVALALVLVALGAAAIPAWRATRQQPVEALTAE